MAKTNLGKNSPKRIPNVDFRFDNAIQINKLPNSPRKAPGSPMVKNIIK